MKKFFSLILCAVLLLTPVMLCSCADFGEDETEKTTKAEEMSGPVKALMDFEAAFNERDLDGIINIFKPDQQSLMRFQFKLTEGLSGMLGDFSGLLSEDMLGGVFGMMLGEYYIDIDVLSEEFNEDETRATLTVVFDFGDTEEEDTFEMVKISDKWYADIDIVKM